MSKIYKPQINGKPKRPGTHQYHYLGPTVVVVVGKLDPTVGQLCFRHNFQTVRNMQKETTEMSSEGPKMVGGRYGLAENGLKWPKNHKMSGDPRWSLPPLRRPDPGASGGDWPGNLAGVIFWRWRTYLAGACCRWLAGDASFCPKLHGSQMVPKRPNSVFTILESFSYGFGAQDGVLGAMVSFGMQSYVYIGLRVAFR